MTGVPSRTPHLSRLRLARLLPQVLLKRLLVLVSCVPLGITLQLLAQAYSLVAKSHR